MARLTKAQKIEKAEKFVGLETDPHLTSIQRIGRLAQAFNTRRKEFDAMEAMVASVLGSLLTEAPRG